MERKALTLGELQDQCDAAIVITREEGYSLALMAVLENFHERLSRIERAMFDEHEAPTPRKTVSGATFQAASMTQAITQTLNEGRAAAGLEVDPPRRITKPGL